MFRGACETFLHTRSHRKVLGTARHHYCRMLSRTGASLLFVQGDEGAQEVDLKPREFLAQYSDSIYTTACVRDGEVIDFQLHVSRLARCDAVADLHL